MITSKVRGSTTLLPLLPPASLTAVYVTLRPKVTFESKGLHTTLTATADCGGFAPKQDLGSTPTRTSGPLTALPEGLNSSCRFYRPADALRNEQSCSVPVLSSDRYQLQTARLKIKDSTTN